MELSSVVALLFQFRLNLKIYHWQTKNFARHKATDSLVDATDEFIDVLVEYAQGLSGTRIAFADDMIGLRNYNDQSGCNLVKDLLVFTDSLKDQWDDSIENKRQE